MLLSTDSDCLREERSLTVKFRCGNEELLDVTEPSRCAYEAKGWPGSNPHPEGKPSDGIRVLI